MNQSPRNTVLDKALRRSDVPFLQVPSKVGIREDASSGSHSGPRSFGGCKRLVGT